MIGRFVDEAMYETVADMLKETPILQSAFVMCLSVNGALDYLRVLRSEARAPDTVNEVALSLNLVAIPLLAQADLSPTTTPLNGSLQASIEDK